MVVMASSYEENSADNANNHCRDVGGDDGDDDGGHADVIGGDGLTLMVTMSLLPTAATTMLMLNTFITCLNMKVIAGFLKAGPASLRYHWPQE